MAFREAFAVFFLPCFILAHALSCNARQVQNVQKAFSSLSSEPEVLVLSNDLEVPLEKGHFQGVQIIERNGNSQLYISGSSLTTAYLLQANVESKVTEKVIVLETEPYRHAGGFQVSGDYLAIGVEDNFIKTTSKVQIYDHTRPLISQASAVQVFERFGEAEDYTAGAVGLLNVWEAHLMVVGNWDSRDWDFYKIDIENRGQILFESHKASDEWASYQAINLVKDAKGVYAIGLYSNDGKCYADLILVSNAEYFAPIMKKVNSKVFNCSEEVDFSGAAGLQVDRFGKLHIWATQKYTGKTITVNRFRGR